MERIIEYLKEKYQPLAMIVYGSYADGTNGEDSDFDCLIVSESAPISHDTDVVFGVTLDVFLYRPEELEGEIDPYEFVQIENGSILMDSQGIARSLMLTVRSYLNQLPEKPRDELLSSVAWCEKMTRRAERGDAEGYFRWHWLLCDSLELYCDLLGMRYLGPKKTLAALQRKDPEGYALYESALKRFDMPSLNEWIGHLKRAAEALSDYIQNQFPD